MRHQRGEATPPGDDFIGYYDLYPAWAIYGLIYFTRYTSFNDGFCQDSNETMSVNPSSHVVKGIAGVWAIIVEIVLACGRERPSRDVH